VGSPRTRYAKSGDLDIAYQVLGDGPIDLLVVPPGFSVMEPSWDWPALGDFWRGLARFARVILLDKRGTGLSDRVTGVPTLEERMDDVRAVLDAVGAERVALLGGSEAGPITTLFAATYPDRVVALVLVSALVTWSAVPDLEAATTRPNSGCSNTSTSPGAVAYPASCSSPLVWTETREREKSSGVSSAWRATPARSSAYWR